MLERYALGFADEQVTHTLKAVDESRVLVRKPKNQRPEAECRLCGEHTFDWYEWKEKRGALHEADSLSAGVCRIPPMQGSSQLGELVAEIGKHDFSRRTVFADVVLDLKGGHTAAPHQAFIVAEAAPNVIDGHNGMFAGPLMDFLTAYIGFAEAKRLFPQLPQSVTLELEDCP